MEKKLHLLGLNPHAGDNGVLGDEERCILEAREIAHQSIRKNIYTLPIVPDIALHQILEETIDTLLLCIMTKV